MRAIICDICGKVIDTDSYTIITVSQIENGRNAMLNPNIDICNDCKNKIVTQIKAINGRIPELKPVRWTNAREIGVK